ncbi:MAG: TetR/AcrR family transcriptional regulator, regulator of autoinduction and epiphytic fitness [Chloroflexota bacterium]|nr:TetR/AcrR family transcriptional regulator, regulator of autoinduction and epiphytic fitness [Chloroflexota bacterium]
MATRTRDRILEQAAGVFAMGEKPTVAQFAEAAGVSRASFYRAFESRGALLSALAVQPEPGARERILDAAVVLVGEHGLAALSMDDLATLAGVSRATLYRLFPGKPALFTSLIRTYSPMEPVTRLALELKDELPEVVMPEIARTVYRTVYGSAEPRIGLLRAVFFEVSSLAPDAEESAREAMQAIIGSVGMYVMSQMTAGRLRPMSPLLALQGFVGPIFFHVLTRPLIERVLGIDVDGEVAVTELAEGWLRSMRPDEEGAR